MVCFPLFHHRSKFLSPLSPLRFFHTITHPSFLHWSSGPFCTHPCAQKATPSFHLVKAFTIQMETLRAGTSCYCLKSPQLSTHPSASQVQSRESVSWEAPLESPNPVPPVPAGNSPCPSGLWISGWIIISMCIYVHIDIHRHIYSLKIQGTL